MNLTMKKAQLFGLIVTCMLLGNVWTSTTQTVSKNKIKYSDSGDLGISSFDVTDATLLLELDRELEEFQAFRLNSSALKTQVKSSDFDGNLRLDFGELSFNLRIGENDIRSANYKSRSITENGMVNNPIAENILYAGIVDQAGGDFVRMTIEDQMVYGLFSLNGEEYLLEPLDRWAGDAYRDVYLFYAASNVKDTGGSCIVKEVEQQQKELKPVSQNYKLDECIEVEYAVANDFSFHQANGSNVGQTNAFILTIVNLFNPNYQNFFEDDYTFTVVENFNSTCNTCDPWTSSTNAGTLLDSFTGLGNSSFSNSFDVASLWTNRNFDGSTVGIAWLGVMCSGSRYNCLQNFTGNTQSLRTMTAHELGHNFDMSHDASGSPDIMAPSVNPAATTWSNASINSLNNHVDDVNCLDLCPAFCPSISAVEVVNCNPANGTFTLQVTVNPNGETGAFQLFANGELFNFNYAASTQTVSIPLLPSTGESGLIVEFLDTSIDCFDQETYNSPNPLCFCTTIASEGFGGCSLPAGWSVDHPNGNFSLGTCQSGSSGFAFDCTEYPGFSQAGMAGPPAGFSGCVAVVDDDNAGDGGPTGTGCIISSAVNTNGFTDITLEFDWQNEVTGQGNGIFTADVWNGSGWINVLSSTSDQNGHAEIDVSDYVNTEFQTRFCYNDEGEWSWGIAIDNYELCGFETGTPTCNDGIQNGTETDVDCGGATCPACVVFGCINPQAHNFNPSADQSDGSCMTCFDGIVNGDEEGVDCGGSNPNCVPCFSCTDGIQNGNEEDVDCGGDCPACPDCFDGIQNQNETGIDCGGDCAPCPTCDDGIANGDEEGIDCGGECAPCPSCTDGILNGNEEEVDCGGDCTACPTCNDGIQNGDEEGIDCGAECGDCFVGLQLSAFIEGAFDSNTALMKTDLLDQNLLPISQPYSAGPFFYFGTETVTAESGFPSNVVDWVLVQIRDANDQSTVLSQRAGFLRNDGKVIDVNGQESLAFEGLDVGTEYYVSLHHRSHIAIVSNSPVSLPNNFPLDFAFNPSNIQGSGEQVKELGGGFYGLHSGDIDNNSIVNTLDFLIWSQNATDVNVYANYDLDLNGIVNILDFVLWFENRSVVGLQFLN